MHYFILLQIPMLQDARSLPGLGLAETWLDRLKWKRKLTQQPAWSEQRHIIYKARRPRCPRWSLHRLVVLTSLLQCWFNNIEKATATTTKMYIFIKSCIYLVMLNWIPLLKQKPASFHIIQKKPSRHLTVGHYDGGPWSLEVWDLFFSPPLDFCLNTSMLMAMR